MLLLLLALGILAGLCTALLPLLPTASAASTGSVTSPGGPGPASDPLANRPWGVYTGGADGVYPAYEAATDAGQRSLLAKVALRPRVRWFGSHNPADEIGAKIRDYISTTQGGNPDVVVQMAIFRLWPHGEKHKLDPLTDADRAAYRHWVDNAAAAIGSSRVAMVLEPDLAVSLTGWHPWVRLHLAAYAAKKFGSLPHTSVYIDAADSDWLSASKAVSMIRKAGIQYVRGFALGATHYTGVSADIDHGQAIAHLLARAGLPHHFVIDTADNGRPFTWKQYWEMHPKGDFSNAQTCATTTQTRCDTLGIPPTADVDNPRWRLNATRQRIAHRLVDGYLWFGRPWLVDQASPFSLSRTLSVAATTPW